MTDIKRESRTKTARITLRLEQQLKEKWLKHCESSKIYISDYIINTVEGKMLENDRKQIMAFIETQGNIFAKIENNINQIARYINQQRITNRFIQLFKHKTFSSYEKKSTRFCRIFKNKI